MKTFVNLILMLAISLIGFAQNGINYKAIIKDDLGNLVANDLIVVQFSILQGVAQTNVYQETHTPTTDANGLIIVNIGEGTSSDVFTDIDWAADDHFLNVQINTGNGLTDMGTTQFMAVPYALSATNAASKIDELNDGKSDINGSSLFLGKDAGLNDESTNNRNIGIGFEALKNNTSGSFNTAIGFQALYSNTSGYSNTANGTYALYANTTGSHNTVNGTQALRNNTTGSNNTANGLEALLYNTTGHSNTANGSETLVYNSTGHYNTANGRAALRNNISGYSNTANGYNALRSNNTGYENTANGRAALYYNNTGYSNTANGYYALLNNTTGDENTANGYQALQNNIDGIRNTASGFQALFSNTSGNYNTAIGFKALYSKITGHWNTAIGRQALFDLTSGTNNMGFGYNAQVPNSTSSNQIRMGNTAITSAAIQVAWNVTSDLRWKDNIRDLPYGLDLVKQLKPVDYTRKNNEDKTREMGFIAQDVQALLAKVGYTDQGFLSKDDKGYISLRYNDFIALLTKAIQEQQEIIEKLNSKLETQALDKTLANKDLQALLKRVEAIESNQFN